MKDKINFLARFLALTLVFFLIWIPLGKIYLVLLAWVSKYVLWIMGYDVALTVVGGSPLFLYRGIEIGMVDAHLANFNVIPLVALILATPRIEPVRRARMLAIGVFLLFVMHIADFVFHFPMYFRGSGIAETVVVFMAVGEVAVPFVLWFVLAQKEILESMR
ncbi:MAG: hypothetical protein J7J06_06295 [Methanosarcinales archaeon]|nr:hypothetical protein [Methanosarcinales archaeon]